MTTTDKKDEVANTGEQEVANTEEQEFDFPISVRPWDCEGRTPISLRVPTSVLNAYKKMAKDSKDKYQAIINRAFLAGLPSNIRRELSKKALQWARTKARG